MEIRRVPSSWGNLERRIEEYKEEYRKGYYSNLDEGIYVSGSQDFVRGYIDGANEAREEKSKGKI